MTELHFTGNVRRLRLRPGDTIVIEATRPISSRMAETLTEDMRLAFPDNPCIVLDAGLRIAASVPSEAAA